MKFRIPESLVKAYFQDGHYLFFDLNGNEIFGVIDSDIFTAHDQYAKASITLLVDVVNKKPCAESQE